MNNLSHAACGFEREPGSVIIALQRFPYKCQSEPLKGGGQFVIRKIRKLGI